MRRERPILYLVNSFPSLSETFLMREIEALSRAGLPLRIAALSPRHAGPVHPSAEPWLRGVVRRPSPSSPALWLGVLGTCLISPVAFTSALRMAAAMVRHEPTRAREVGVALVSAAYLAWRLRGASVRHVHATWANFVATTGLLLAEIKCSGFSFAAHAADIFTGDAGFVDAKSREADFSVACSLLAYQWLRDQFPPRQRGRAHLVRHGLDLARYAPTPKGRPTPARIVSVGRLVPKKGFMHLLRAASILDSREAVEFELHIYGGGPQERDLRQVINALQLGHRVFLHGPATEEQVLEAYRQADLFVLASAQTADGDNEGVPNVLVEALAMQVPVVTTRTGGIPELIQDGVTGLLVEPGAHSDLATAMERLLVDDRLRASVMAAGRLKVEREYNILANARDLLELFRSAAG